jgi:hypothetical protein
LSEVTPWSERKLHFRTRGRDWPLRAIVLNIQWEVDRALELEALIGKPKIRLPILSHGSAVWLDRFAGFGLTVWGLSSIAVDLQLAILRETGSEKVFAGILDERFGDPNEKQTYCRLLVEKIGWPGEGVLFLSHKAKELDAAAGAGLLTCLLDHNRSIHSRKHPSTAHFTEMIEGLLVMQPSS